MNRKTRKILMITGVVLFLILTPLFISYCRGYRIDLQRWRVVKTGGLFFHTEPRAARILINGKQRKKTDILFSSALIENLIPRRYTVRIEKPEYRAWEKKLEVKEGMVTSAKNITLLPQEIQFELLSKDISRFWVSPSGERILLEQETEQKWGLSMLETEDQETRVLFQKQKPGLKIEKITWSSEEETLVLHAIQGGKTRFFSLSLSGNTVELKEITLPDRADPCFFSPADSNILFYELPSSENGTSIFKTDLSSSENNETPSDDKLSPPQEAEKEIVKNPLAFTLAKKEIYWIDQEGRLNKTGLDNHTQTLPFLPLSLEEEGEIAVFNSEVFVLSGKTLYQLDREDMRFEEAEASVQSWNLSPDKRKMALWNKNEIKVLFLKDQNTQPLRQKGRTIFLTRFSGEIEEIFWWNNHYLIVSERDNNDPERTKIKVIETDNRDRAQVWEIKRFFSPSFYFSPEQKRGYVLSQNRFFVSEPIK